MIVARVLLVVAIASAQKLACKAAEATRRSMLIAVVVTVVAVPTAQE